MNFLSLLKAVLFFISIILFKFSQAQQVKFLEENTSESVKFAPVYVIETKQWYFTDSLGIINFQKSKIPFKISVEAMGYQKLETEISKNQTVYLKKTTQTLSEVIVRPKKYKPKLFETENGKMNGGYYFSRQKSLKSFGTIINFKDSLIWLNNITFSALIKGDLNAKLARFRLYKFSSDVNKWGFFTNFPSNEIEEIYSYELKDVFNAVDKKWVTFILPPNIILEKGFYLVTFQLVPNGSDEILHVKYSNDKFVHSFYNYNATKFWGFDRYKLDGKYYNLKVKIEYDTN
jgi:hypothetical protein